jgi:hypothetical protein
MDVADAGEVGAHEISWMRVVQARRPDIGAG